MEAGSAGGSDAVEHVGTEGNGDEVFGVAILRLSLKWLQAFP